jgi:hypothetical protein
MVASGLSTSRRTSETTHMLSLIGKDGIELEYEGVKDDTCAVFG